MAASRLARAICGKLLWTRMRSGGICDSHSFVPPRLRVALRANAAPGASGAAAVALSANPRPGRDVRFAIFLIWRGRTPPSNSVPSGFPEVHYGGDMLSERRGREDEKVVSGAGVQNRHWRSHLYIMIIHV